MAIVTIEISVADEQNQYFAKAQEFRANQQLRRDLQSNMHTEIPKKLIVNICVESVDGRLKSKHVKSRMDVSHTQQKY
jgi:hypothetical protein